MRIMVLLSLLWVVKYLEIHFDICSVQDDYFLVSKIPNDAYTFFNQNAHNNEQIRRQGLDYYRKYYICDQFDGLLSFLKTLDNDTDVIGDLPINLLFNDDEIRMVSELPNMKGQNDLSFIKVENIDKNKILVKMSDIKNIIISKVGEESYKCVTNNNGSRSTEVVDTMYQLMMFILGHVDE